MKSRIALIWTVAAGTAAIGLYIVKDIRGLYDYLAYVASADYSFDLSRSWDAIALPLLYGFGISRIISAYGLAVLASWGKKLAIVALGGELAFRLVGFMNIWTYYDRHPEARTLLEEVERQVEAGQAGQWVYVSMIPSYLIAVSCVVFIAVLLVTNFNELKKGDRG